MIWSVSGGCLITSLLCQGLAGKLVGSVQQSSFIQPTSWGCFLYFWRVIKKVKGRKIWDEPMLVCKAWNIYCLEYSLSGSLQKRFTNLCLTLKKMVIGEIGMWQRRGSQKRHHKITLKMGSYSVPVREESRAEPKQKCKTVLCASDGPLRPEHMMSGRFQ